LSLGGGLDLAANDYAGDSTRGPLFDIIAKAQRGLGLSDEALSN
jgi:hypothetical protein